MRDFIRRWRPAVVVLAGVLSLAGCADGPSRVGSAAIVGDTRIALDSVQRDFTWLLKNIPEAKQLQQEGKLEVLSRYTVQQRIRHLLVTAAAKQEGLRADPKQVDELIDQAGGPKTAHRQMLTTPGLTRQLATDIVLLQELGRHYVDRLTVKVVGAFVAQESAGSTSQSKAKALARKIAADPERAAEIAAEGDNVLDRTLKLSEVVRGQESALAQTPLFAVKPGTVVVTQPDPQQGSVWLVALVQQRTVTESAAAENPKKQQYSPELLAQVGLQMLRPVAEKLGVTVSPRFGVWDQAGMTIAESPEHFNGLLLTARAEQ